MSAKLQVIFFVASSGKLALFIWSDANTVVDTDVTGQEKFAYCNVNLINNL